MGLFNSESHATYLHRLWQSKALLAGSGGVTRQGVYPPPQALVIESVEIEPNGAVLFILVPPQPDALMPFLVTGAIRDDQLRGSGG
jgi:hypothetical protein